MASSIKDKLHDLECGLVERQRLVQRSLFGGLAGLRYVREIPRLRRLNRIRMQTVSTEAELSRVG